MTAQQELGKKQLSHQGQEGVNYLPHVLKVAGSTTASTRCGSILTLH